MSMNLKLIPKLLKILQEKNIADLLFSVFLASQYLNLMLTCKRMYSYLKSRMDNYRKLVKEKFCYQYNETLNLTNYNFRYQREQGRSFKIHLILSFSLRQTLTKNTTYQLGCSYKIRKNNKKEQNYFWKYQFQPVGTSNRQLWMYKEDNQNNKNQFPYTSDVALVGSFDVLTLSLPYFCAQSLVDPTQICFYKMLVKQKSVESFCALQQTCQWTKYLYYENPMVFQLEDIIRCYPDCLQLSDIQYSDVDVKIYKVILKCIKQIRGKLAGHTIQIHQKGGVLIQLKKKGTYDEKSKILSFRIGDKLIIYLKQRE